MDPFLHLLRTAWPPLVVAAPGLFAVWKLWASNRKLVRRDRADLVKIAQEAAAGVIDDLRQEIARLHGELNALRQEYHEMSATKDARIALLEAEVRRWRAIAEANERLLDKHGIPHPKVDQPMWEAKAEGLVMVPNQTEPEL